MALFGTLETLKLQVCDSKFDKAFLYIEKLQDKSSSEYKSISNTKVDECNKIVLDENCFVLEQSYITKNKENCLFESHKKYIDIQYMFEGDEIMEVENVNNLEVSSIYDEKLDYAKYFQSKRSSSLLIKESEMAIFYPHDAHMPCIKIDENIERLMRLAIEEKLLASTQLSIAKVLRDFKSKFIQYYPDVSKENLPTRRQFEYFYKREYDQSVRVQARTDEGIYKKDVRPLAGTATAASFGPGSRYEIDATIADIYLVADDDRSKIIGRPTLYIVIDVFSRMIAGFYIGFDNPSYVVAMQAFINACVDKTEICHSLGLNISVDDWPCIGLPDVVLADRGELMSNQLDSLISTFNVRIESAPPRRGDAKGIVERCFKTLQAEFKPYAPGVVVGNKIKKHGERDYRLDAAITISDFARIILRTILFRNNHHVLSKYDRDADLPIDMPSIPIHLWRWGLQNRTEIGRAQV